MKESLLFGSEKVVSELDDQTVTLTTHRIRKNDDGKLQSILLPHVSSVEVHYQINHKYLIAAIVSGLISGFLYLRGGYDDYSTLALIAGVVLFVVYIQSKRHVLSIGSSSTKITVPLKGLSHENVIKFVNDIEETIPR